MSDEVFTLSHYFLHQENISLVSHTCQAFFILFVTYFYLYVKKEAKSWLSNLEVWENKDTYKEEDKEGEEDDNDDNNDRLKTRLQMCLKPPMCFFFIFGMFLFLLFLFYIFY